MHLAGYIFIIGAVVATYLLADALDAVDEQVEELFGDQLHLPEDLKAGSNSGGGVGGCKAAGLRGSHTHTRSNRTERGDG